MFSVDERAAVGRRLLEWAEADPAVVAAAVTGSAATGEADRWSDIDLALGIDGPVEAVIDDWTRRLYRDHAAVHHWDLPAGPAIYRVFLLPGCLEADIAFTPAAEFGPRGPHWRTVFGHSAPDRPAARPGTDNLAGLAWHHALHARVCIERSRWWQAEHWISALRGQVLALACLRLGYPTAYAKGAHLLPEEVTGPLAATLVRGLAAAELRRALAAAGTALAAELGRSDAALAGRLQPTLSEVTAPAPS